MELTDAPGEHVRRDGPGRSTGMKGGIVGQGRVGRLGHPQRAGNEVDDALAVVEVVGVDVVPAVADDELRQVACRAYNRYISDEEICQSVAAMWAKIGVRAKLRTLPLSTYFPMIQRYEASIYMLGWGGGTTCCSTPMMPSPVHCGAWFMWNGTRIPSP